MKLPRAILALACWPLLLPPGVCACPVSAAAPPPAPIPLPLEAKKSCGCCHHAPPADHADRLSDTGREPQPKAPHAPGCPSSVAKDRAAVEHADLDDTAHTAVIAFAVPVPPSFRATHAAPVPAPNAPPRLFLTHCALLV